jgi:hypothetical protein
MRISEHVFEAQDVVLDFHQFDHCTFRDCRLIIHGVGAFRLINCDVVECNWHFRGPAAVTMKALGYLYRGGFALVVESALHEIMHPPKHS